MAKLNQNNNVQRLQRLAEVDLISLDGENYLDETLQKIVEIGNQLIPSNMGVHIILWDSEAETFSLSVTSIKDLGSQEFSCNTRNEGGVTRYIVDTLETVVVKDVSEDPFRKGRKMKDHGVQSYVGVPMALNQQVFGVLFIFNDTPMMYKEEDVLFCQLMAKRASAAVRDARRFLEMEQKATRDGLTDLLNKSTFLEIAGKICKKTERKPSDNALVFIDIDEFKYINDRFGHAEGDRILKLVAQTIKNSIRAMDVAARYGGDEFMILFPGTGKIELRFIVQRMKMKFLSIDWGLGDYAVTVSIGTATTNSLCKIDSLIEMADRKMYNKKRTGKLGYLET